MVLSYLIDDWLLLRDNAGHGAPTANSVSRSDLSRDESGRPARGHFPRGRGPGGVAGRAGGSLLQDGSPAMSTTA